MTPSRAYEEAFHRDAGHDEMQAEFKSYLCGREDTLVIVKGPDGGMFKVPRIHVEAEFALVDKCGLLKGFADIVEIFETSVGGFELKRITVYELKPDIGSAGALRRQCAALSVVLEQIMGRNWRVDFAVIPVVMCGDKKIEVFKSVWSRTFMIWDPETKSVEVIRP